MADLSFKNVTKNYGAVVAIPGLSATIRDGDFVALVGPSGCGKSTTLRMIAGLEDITSGTIEIGGRVLNDLDPKDRNIAMVFQNYALYPHMTVAENMAFALRVAGMPKAERLAKARAAATILGLEDMLDRYPRQLSGGQRQRVAMGRAIVRDPAVFLFDEPLSNLDAKLRVQMRIEIREMHERLKTTILFVTHDQVEAMTMANQIMIFNKGNLEQYGTPLELYDRPANVFVATFIGSPTMNLVAGVAEPGGIRAADETLWPAAFDADMGRKVLMGVRPEHITLTETGIPANVRVVEPTGAETHIVVMQAGQKMNVVLRGRFEAASGTKVSLSYDAALTHLFDAETGMRLSGG